VVLEQKVAFVILMPRKIDPFLCREIYRPRRDVGMYPGIGGNPPADGVESRLEMPIQSKRPQLNIIVGVRRLCGDRTLVFIADTRQIVRREEVPDYRKSAVLQVCEILVHGDLRTF
jgi:hypothetical protein